MKRRLLLCGVVLACGIFSSLAQSPPDLLIDLSTDSKVRLSWPETPGNILLEETGTLTLWQPSPQIPTLLDGQFSVLADVSGGARFFRLHETGGLPPDPVSIAPPLQQGIATLLAVATEFLYTGPNPIQTGVAPGTIEGRRAAVLRGTVLTRAGAGLSGVTISILAHPQFGQTLSRADGAFDLAVNGGGLLTVNYEKSGFLPVQRQINVPWQDYATLPDVVLIELDTEVTPVTLGTAAMQVARGSAVSDADGTRRATLLIPAGTTANLVMPDGTTQSIGALSVRATEYTVGANGPDAMPGVLPPNSGYTYAVELSADEAIAAGARSVRFNQPLPYYVENFLGFPVGGAVPAGYYDRTKAAWVPSLNGRVIRITAIAGGMADVDSVGSGSRVPLTLSNAERQQLASLYPVGQELWRVPTPHFTPWDHNWPYGPPPDAEPPDVPPPTDTDQIDDPTCSSGSIIECENQALGERVAIVGTPYTLNYRSTRVPGRTSARGLEISLSAASLPASAKRIDLDVQVAGKTFRESFPAMPNQKTSFLWDGRDAYGRALQGAQPASVSIGYVYDAVYLSPAQLLTSFGAFGGTALSANRAASEAKLTQRFASTIGSFDMRAIGLGGWTLASHHVYDVAKQILYLGDGPRRSAERIGTVLEALRLRPNDLRDVAVGPDGSVYLSSSLGEEVVYRVAPDGSFSVVAGDGRPTPSTFLSTPTAIALGPDGALYVAETFAHRIRRIGPNGMVSVVAGIGVSGFSGDGGLATAARLAAPSGLAVAADGSVYIADTDNSRIRRIRTDGFINTIAGGGAALGDEGPAILASIENPRGLAFGPDGSLYIVQGFPNRIRRIAPDGIITTVAGSGLQGFAGDGGPATAAMFRIPNDVDVALDGGLYIADTGNGSVRYVSPDGTISTVAGTGMTLKGVVIEGRPPTSVTLGQIRGVAVGVDGTVYLADSENAHVLSIAPALPGLTLLDVVVPSSDGRLLYHFNSSGRHLLTLEARTGAILLEFGYDANGRLNQVSEKTGSTDNVTTIEHDGNGNPTAIVGPFGQRTMLGVDANGFLSSITNPAGEQVQLGSTAGGLLTSLTDPRGKTSTFSYDADGRLANDTDPVAGAQTLVRTTIASGFTVARSTGLGRTASYKIEAPQVGMQMRTITAPDGTEIVSQETMDAGLIVATAPDGAMTSLELAPDPRFGMVSPVSSSLTIALPDGPTLTALNSRTAELANPLDPLSFTTLTETSTVAGRTTTTTFTAANRTEVSTTPAGRTTTLIVDALGRPAQLQLSGLVPSTLTYDSRGRLETFKRGSGVDERVHSLAYNPQGLLASITDPIGQTVLFSYDAAGRVLTRTLPGGRVVAYAYDAAGNVTSVTPPGRPAHTFEYSDRSERTRITPPAVVGTGPSSLAFNLDRQPTTTTRPDDRTVTIGYDASGRPNARVFATGGTTTGTDTFAYDPAGRVSTAVAAGGVTSSYGYTGQLVTSESWSGAIAGSVTASHDDAFRLLNQSVNGANPIAYSYDDDSLLTGAGALIYTRDPQHGRITASTLGVVNTTTGYNSFGESTSYAVSANASPLYNAGLTRDKLGRIVSATETIGGVTNTYVYSYDAAGQLTGVTRNGASVESYTYDGNGNRTSATIAGTGIDASYDAQDRLTSYGTMIYAYTAAGELLSKTSGGQTTTYQYDAAGNLLGVNLPNGTGITYVVDALDRRVGKRVNGILTQGFLYGDTLRPVAELDGSGALVSRFVYAGLNAPAYMIKDGIAHRIVTDRGGSVRLVLDATTGAVAQRLDYDTFGNVILDSNPGFQPFGFAGGLYDPATGLVRFGARDYDPQVGRWTAKDPIGFEGGDTSLYRYVRNDPVNLVDLTGLDIWDTVSGFFDQLNQDLMLANPIVLLSYTLETGLRAAFIEMGWDPGYPTWHDVVRPPPPPWVDAMSADYTKGELIAQCVGIALAAAEGVAGGVGRGVGALEARLNAAAVNRAADQMNREVLASAARKEAAKRALPKVEVIKSEFGAGTVNRGRNAPSGFTGR